MPRKKRQRERNRKKARARARFWAGTISFGLINIPVRLYSATQERNLNLYMLRKGDLYRISYERVCRATGE